MSLSAGSRAHSPLSSGRSSPQPLRRRIDEDPTKNDPKYKRFSTSVDRALSLFEGGNLQEWADYISFLGRLLKALQSHPSLPLIPSKTVVSQRLAQCLNPTLPSGVHQKTIEVYSYIFSLIGKAGLAADLPLWTPGLTPVLSYASLTLKPHYLSLLERFYLPLGTTLRPAVRALILALLPGIDEENGEYFDRTLGLIDGVRGGVQDDAYFWQCVLLATITSPARRQGALAFLSRKLPKLAGKGDKPPEIPEDLKGRTEEELVREVDALISPEPGLLVRALCSGLLDDQPLAQRGFLDLLVTNVPLSSPVLQKKVSMSDLQLLVTSASGVVLRRDMGLNRRLWAWYIGPEEPRGKEYFEANGLEALVRGLMNMLEHHPDATASERVRPYRIALSLMDHFEVGSLIVPKLFFPIIEAMRSFEKEARSKQMYTEVFKSASAFFDGVEAGLIWGQFLEKISLAFVGEEDMVGSRAEKLRAVRFIIRSFNVREDEMVFIHAPILVLAILLHLGDNSKDNARHTADSEQRKTALLLAEDVWQLVPDVALRKHSATVGAVVNSVSENVDGGESKLQMIERFYAQNEGRFSVDGGSSEDKKASFSVNQIAEWIFSELASSVQEALNGDISNFGLQCGLFVTVIQKVPEISADLLSTTIKPLIINFLEILGTTETTPFIVLQGMSKVVAELIKKDYLDEDDVDDLVFDITKGLWFYLSPDIPKFHVESVRALWILQEVLGLDRKIEAAVATVMVETAGKGSAEPGRKFAVLWMHSVGGLAGNKYHLVLTRPLFLFLDALNDDNTEMAVFAQGWLQNLGSINRLFWILATKLLDCKFLKNPGKRNGEGAPYERPEYIDDDFLEIATYYFHTLVNVLRYSTNHVLATLASEVVVVGDEKTNILAQRGYGDEEITLQSFFATTALWAIDGDGNDDPTEARVTKLHKMALGVLHQLLLSPYSKSLADMELENVITARLISTMTKPTKTYIQVSLLDVLHAALKLSLDRPTSHLGHLRQLSQDLNPNKPRISISGDEKSTSGVLQQFTPPKQLLRCLIGGFSNASSRPVLDSWMFFLGECLPLLRDVIFQVLMPLVECLCEQIKLTFETLKTVFREGAQGGAPEFGGKSPEITLVALLNGLEQILAVAHAKLLQEEVKSSGPKSPDAPSGGFFGNMVSGVFAVENSHSRSSSANNRLTVLLCFQDTVKICHSIWSWGDINISGASLDAASKDSWVYTSLRMKGRARRILEHMFAAETLECLETLIELWPGRLAPQGERKVGGIFKLINVLDGSRPKHTIPAIFNAIYSRTNPSALDPARRSTLTAELTDMDVVVFLVEYAKSLEDDAMDEIWQDCMVFLRDVLANPFPHRQTLPSLLSFTATLGEKVDNTNFGEQRKMRKELADLFLRMLTAVFTVTPVGQRTFEPPVPLTNLSEKTPSAAGNVDGPSDRPPKGRTTPDDVVPILVDVIPNLRKVLVEPDRVLNSATTIATSLVGPTFRSKAFPTNMSAPFLALVQELTRLPGSQKAWRKELSDTFLDNKFFQSPVDLVDPAWVKLARQYILHDRDCMVDLLGRITPPTTAGVLFGVGATSARTEADRKAQLNLKRIAFLIFAAPVDTFVPTLTELESKLVELLGATNISSPSSHGTRADIYIVLRALALRTSPVHLSSLWPLINTELHYALTALLPDADAERTYTDFAILHAAKLLDTLLVLAPDEWQLQEWLFITDTIEAVFRPPGEWNPIALVEQVALGMPGCGHSSAGRTGVNDDSGSSRTGRRPWFRGGEEAGGGDVRASVVAPWLRMLSIACYEGVYAMGRPDVAACECALVLDLFEEGMNSTSIS